MSYEEIDPHKEAMKIVVGQTVVGMARVKDGVVEGELTVEGRKKLFPDYDPTQGLSILEISDREDDVLRDYPAFDIDLNMRWHREKGTFDA